VASGNGIQAMMGPLTNWRGGSRKICTAQHRCEDTTTQSGRPQKPQASAANSSRQGSLNVNECMHC